MKKKEKSVSFPKKKDINLYEGEKPFELLSNSIDFTDELGYLEKNYKFRRKYEEIDVLKNYRDLLENLKL